MLAPTGAPGAKENTSVLAGRSESVALAVNVRVLPSSTVLSGIDASEGAEFVSFTTTVKVCVALRLGVPSSNTRTTIVFVAGPCASVGVHVNAPETGSRLVRSGAETMAKVRLLGGISASEALKLNASTFPSITVLLPIGASVGVAFTSVMVTEKVFASFRGGEPLSVTRTVIG